MLDQPFKSAKKMCIPVKEMQLLPDLVPVLVADFVVLHLHQTKSAQKRCIYIKRNQQKKKEMRHFVVALKHQGFQLVKLTGYQHIEMAP
jgi:hypothetical protein